jgi:hypothetical protein
LTAYFRAGTELTSGAIVQLEDMYELAGEPGTFEDWLKTLKPY